MRDYRFGLTIAAWVFLAGSVGAATNVVSEPFEGVRLIHSKSMTPRQIDMWVAEIDPSAPGISFLVTPSNGDLPGDTTPLTVRAFATKVGAQLGINGSFFSVAAKGTDGKAQYNVSGLSVSKGDAYSPFARGFVDAINFSRENVATIIRGTGDDRLALSAKGPKGGQAHFAPRTPHDHRDDGARPVPDKHVPGTIPLKTKEINIGFEHQPAVPLYNALSGKSRLVKDGKNVAGNDPSIHPRTAVAIKADGKVLLFTVDGREKSRSLGLTISEMAGILIKFGAREAINLDGGGSTTFVMDDPNTPENDPKVMNLPCDPFSKENEGKEHGKERPVGNALAVFARVRSTPAKSDLVAQQGKSAVTSTKTAVACSRRSCRCCRRPRHLLFGRN